MEWLRDNAFLAAWLAPIVAAVVFLLQENKSHFANVDWSRVLVRFAFLVSLAVVISPKMDHAARLVANTLMFMCLGWIMVDKKQK
jgi:hypothetical protein